MILAPPENTETTAGGNGENFVSFHLGELGFVMERAHFYAAIHRDKPQELDKAACPGLCPYLRELLPFEGRKVLMFNLDEHLRERFHLAEQGTIKVALIAELDIFGAEGGALVSGLLREQFPDCAGDALAFRVGGDGAIREIAYRDFRLLPRGLHDTLAARGLAACRFIDDRIEFVIDPAKLALHCLQPSLRPFLEAPAAERIS